MWGSWDKIILSRGCHRAPGLLVWVIDVETTKSKLDPESLHTPI